MYSTKSTILDQYFDQHQSITGIKFKFPSNIFLKEQSPSTTNNLAISVDKSYINDTEAISDRKFINIKNFAQKSNFLPKCSPKLNDFNSKLEASVPVQGTQVNGSKAVFVNTEYKGCARTAPCDSMYQDKPPPIK